MAKKRMPPFSHIFGFTPSDGWSNNRKIEHFSWFFFFFYNLPLTKERNKSKAKWFGVPFCLFFLFVLVMYLFFKFKAICKLYVPSSCRVSIPDFPSNHDMWSSQQSFPARCSVRLNTYHHWIEFRSPLSRWKTASGEGDHHKKRQIVE